MKDAKTWAAKTALFDEVFGAGRWMTEFGDYNFSVGIGYIGDDGRVRDAVYLVRTPDHAGQPIRVMTVSEFRERAEQMKAGTLPADDPWRVRMATPEEAVAAIREACERAVQRRFGDVEQ